MLDDMLNTRATERKELNLDAIFDMLHEWKTSETHQKEIAPEARDARAFSFDKLLANDATYNKLTGTMKQYYQAQFLKCFAASYDAGKCSDETPAAVSSALGCAHTCD